MVMKTKFMLPFVGSLVLLIGLLLVTAGPAAAQDSSWRAEYYGNPNLSGSPVVVRGETEINNYWGHTAPFPAIPADGFSVRWTRTFNNVPAGTYRVVATMDDGMRIFLNGRPVLDSWSPSSVHTISQDVVLPFGTHTVTVEYFERTGQATAVVNIYQLSSGSSGGSGGGFGGGSGGGQIGGGDGGDLSGAFPNWKAEYFNNVEQAGAPIIVQDDRYLNFNWGSDSPFPGLIPPNDFSVRWTRSEFIPWGHYKVTLRSDDGARLWLNGRVIINNYVNPSLEPQSIEVWSPGDMADLRVDFYDRSKTAAIALSMEKIPNSPGANGSLFVVPGVPNIPPAGGSGGTGGSGGSGGGGISTAIPQCPGVPYPTGFNAVVVSASNLNVRRAPTTLSETMGLVPSCGTIQLTGYRNTSGEWVQTMYNGQLGWLTTEYLVLGSPISSFAVSGN